MAGTVSHIKTGLRGVADYEFLRELGAGSRGRYFLARRPPRLSAPVEFVAVKVFARESTSDTFRRATARLRGFTAVRSPYLATLYDVGQHDGVFYTAMEYLPTGSLGLPAHPVSLALRVRSVGDAARALSALHLAGFSHAAVKPGNVLLDPYGAKLADPDLAHVFSPGQRHPGVGATTAVQFADPEHLLGEPMTSAHDVWSVGLLLHWVVTGDAGYGELPGRDGLLALRRVLSSRPLLHPSLAEPVAELVRECLAPVGERPTAAVVADRVAAIAADMASRPTPGEADQPDGDSRYDSETR